MATSPSSRCRSDPRGTRSSQGAKRPAARSRTGYGAQIKKGVPYLTVLAGDGEVLANQETGALEKGEAHDSERVKSFLDKWSADPWDAETVYQAALSRAKKEKKRLLLHLGAPW